MIHVQQYCSLGTSGIMVSPLGVSTNKWLQGRNDEPVSQVAQSFLDAGGNFFDTAEVYGVGKSERLLGTCLQQNTRPVVVAKQRRKNEQYQEEATETLSGLHIRYLEAKLLLLLLK